MDQLVRTVAVLAVGGLMLSPDKVSAQQVYKCVDW